MFSPAAFAQRNPRIAYAYPAGAQQGQVFEMKLAGQFLDGVSGVHVSGGGVEARLVEHVKPLNGKQLNLFRDRLKDLQQALAVAKRDELQLTVRSEADTNRVEVMERPAVMAEIAELRKKLGNPKNRLRENPQLAEDVVLEVRIASEAAPGVRELRLRTAAGLSNPLPFRIGRLPEFGEKEPNSTFPDAQVIPRTPAVLNGRIMPGDVDRFRLRLTQGTKLVAAASARDLIPYLADAVPGWFQATLALYDAKGNELAYVDDNTFHPDPLLRYEIQRDGDYVIEIKDAIYRGREDFVYRIAVGELPCVTGIFPLGGRVDTETTVRLDGWCLPTNTLAVTPRDVNVPFLPVVLPELEPVARPIGFAVGTLPESSEREPTQTARNPQSVTLPLVINGTIDRPDDQDVFRFSGRAGQSVVAEVQARRLNSPLDSVLRLTDSVGRQIALNDDCEDKAAGLQTHHADSRLQVTLPADGDYELHLSDAQHQGSPAHAYRLRIGEPQPDFELRIVPSTLNVRAGSTIPFTAHALREDGFTNDIAVALRDAPPGFKLTGPRLSGTNDQVRLTLTAPARAREEPFRLELEGRAVVGGRAIIHPALPAEDMMQAFIYRHLVPAQELLVTVLGRGDGRPPVRDMIQRGSGPPPLKTP